MNVDPMKRMLLGRLSKRNIERLTIISEASRKLAATFAPPLPPRNAAPIELIVSELRNLGISEGDSILVHCSIDHLLTALPSDGRADGQVPMMQYASDLIDALLAVVGPRGTLLMPTDAIPDIWKFVTQKKVFDFRRHPSLRGIASEALRRRKDSVRSVHPWYNIAACGRMAEELMSEHERSSPYAMDAFSPWWKFTKAGGKIVLLGVDYEVNSLIHLPEFMHPDDFPIPVFYNRPLNVRYSDANGQEQEMPIAVHANRYRRGNLSYYTKRLDEQYELFQTRSLGETQVSVVDACRQYEALVKEMRQGRCWYDAIYW